MYVVIVYDVNVERVSKVCTFLRRYTNRVQNSVFEGEVTEAQLAQIEHGLNEIIKKDIDSIRFYIFRTKKMVDVRTIGIEKTDIGYVI